jgi:hypothetical protein
MDHVSFRPRFDPGRGHSWRVRLAVRPPRSQRGYRGSTPLLATRPSGCTRRHSCLPNRRNGFDSRRWLAERKLQCGRGAAEAHRLAKAKVAGSNPVVHSYERSPVVYSARRGTLDAESVVRVHAGERASAARSVVHRIRNPEEGVRVSPLASRACSSPGRAPLSHSGGSRFESDLVHVRKYEVRSTKSTTYPPG